jgi:hypothetical protein
MSEEVLAEVPAPEQEATAAPEPVEAQPVKAFTQEELDAAIGKRLAREQRKWERERVVAAPVVAADPRPEQFDSTESYADALAMKKAEQLLYERDVQRQQTEVLGAYHDREEEARNKYDDFEQVAYNPSLKITTVMAQTIQSSDIGPDVAYYLGANPKEADRISRLAPYVQAKEIGRIEAKLASEPMVKKTSSAPPPFTPVTASSKGASTYDTTYPRSIKSMSTSEWIAADRARQVKKMEARLR